MPSLLSLSAVEFPGILRDPSDPRKAIAALGGEQALSTALSVHTSASSLTLNLRSHPTASHSNITSEKPYSPTNLFLLRVTTPQELQLGPSTTPKRDLRLVGHVTSLFRFRTLADFQYHVPRTIPPHVQPSPHHIASSQVFHALSNYPNPSSVPPSNLLLDSLRPRRFARSQPEKGLTDYNFKQYAFPHLAHPHVKHVLVPGRPLGDDRRSDANRLSLLHHRVRMDVDNVPERPPNFDQRPVQRGRETYGELYQLLVKLFEIRPIWIRRALYEGIPERLRKSFKKAISVVAYSFQGTGPFYQAWIRYAYDPRKDPSARKYQVVEVRITNAVILAAQTEEYKSDDGDDAKTTDEADQRDPEYPEPFNMPPSFTLTKIPKKKNNFIQVCDIKLEDVVKVCEEEEATTEFDAKYGFFTEAGFLRLTVTIKQALFAICEARLGPERAKEVLGGAYNTATRRMAKKRNRMYLKDVMKPRESQPGGSAVVANVEGNQETAALSEAIADAKQDQMPSDPLESEVDRKDVANVLVGEAVSRVADLEEEDVMSEADDEEEEDRHVAVEGETEVMSGMEGFEIFGEGDDEDSEDDYM